MKVVRFIFSLALIFLSLLLIAANPMQGIGGLKEPLSSILLLVVFPVLIQGYKIWKDKGGQKPSKLFLQSVSFIGAGILVFFNGGFVGIVWPALPVWGGDLGVFLTNVYAFGSEFIVVVGLAFGVVMAMYEGLLKRLFEIVGFASAAKVAHRKEVGFLA